MNGRLFASGQVVEFVVIVIVALLCLNKVPEFAKVVAIVLAPGTAKHDQADQVGAADSLVQPLLGIGNVQGERRRSVGHGGKR